MKSLPIIGSATEVRTRNLRSKLLQLARITVFCSIILSIHAQHQDYLGTIAKTQDQGQLLPLIREVIPDANSLVDFETDDGLRLLAVNNSVGSRVGFAFQTSPESDHIVGFSGPTDVLLVCSREQLVLRASILHSRDTREHVQQVRDSSLLSDLRGSTLGQLRQPASVDGVSGATLTSLAIIDSIRHRLESSKRKAGQREELLTSLKFPKLPSVESIQTIFPDAASIEINTETHLWRVLDDQPQPIGQVLRSAPYADNVIGYQGPSEVLIGLDAAGSVIGVAVGASYDNEPYVDYVRTDKYFSTLFNEKTISDLAAIDLEQAGIEGVSGATMTSMAVAEGLVISANAHLDRQAVSSDRQAIDGTSAWPQMRELLSRRDISTILLTVLGVVFGLTRLKRFRRLRVLFQLLLIAWLGLINGDLLSQAMWVGWAQNGVPMGSALGLVGLTAVALLIPTVTGQNTYCAHLCPHGAVQQLLRNRLPWRLRLSPRIERCVRLLPFALLCWVLLVACLHLPFSLVDIEPFDAWLWRITGPASLTIAIIGLMASLFLPMAYCRYGCPTGKLLDYLRFTNHGKWTIRDSLGIILLASALLLFAFA